MRHITILGAVAAAASAAACATPEPVEPGPVMEVRPAGAPDPVGELVFLDAAAPAAGQFNYFESSVLRGLDADQEAAIRALCAGADPEGEAADGAAGIAFAPVLTTALGALTGVAMEAVAERAQLDLDERSAAYRGSGSATIERVPGGALRHGCLRMTRYIEQADGGLTPAFDLLVHIDEEPIRLSAPRGRSGPAEIVVRPLRLLMAEPAYQSDGEEAEVAVRLRLDSLWEDDGEGLQRDTVFERVVVRQRWPFTEGAPPEPQVKYFDDPEDRLGFSALRGAKSNLREGDAVTGPPIMAAEALVIEADVSTSAAARRALYRAVVGVASDPFADLDPEG